jgi:hypothetical protein
MKEISDALSDAMFTVCNRIISRAKFDKTYKCRIVQQVSDNKYIVKRDNVEHVVGGASNYDIDQIVSVLLPQNNWSEAFIIYPYKGGS